MRFLFATLALAMLLTAGCLDAGTPDTDDADASPDGTITRVQDRADLPFRTDPSKYPYSYVLEEGPLAILDGVGQTITIDLPAGSGLPTADVHMGLFFPDIDGCDWPADMDVSAVPGGAAAAAAMEQMPEQCRLPVVADVGPYWGEPLLGDVHAEDRGSGRLGEALIENLVPHGYVVAQVSVTGTGDSTGCMDLMGPVEQLGVQEAVRFLGQAPWSNGNVGLIGRSYDGSTPWEAAMAADLPELKTVVPISGLYGQLDLMWKNGSVETRGPGVLWGLYYVFTYSGQDPVVGGDNLPLQGRQIAENLVCADTQAGGAVAAASYLYGGDPLSGQEGASYWAERSFKEDVLANYDGSVYFIHGMQDWNVDPHMAFPFYGELQAKGLDVKGLFGQWGHNYPDRVSEHPDNLRWDWAQDLLEWFDHYLKGTGDRPQLHVEMESDQNQWRIEETWPPAHAVRQSLELDAADARQDGDAPAPLGPTVSPDHSLTWTLEFSEDTHVAGLPTFHVDVTPTGPGGQLYAALYDRDDGRRIGHAVMDLRYHEGGSEMQTVVPGQTITARMEFFPLDGVILADHTTELVLSNTGADYLPSAVSDPIVVDAGTLRLPVVEPTADQLFTPPGWEETERMETEAET